MYDMEQKQAKHHTVKIMEKFWKWNPTQAHPERCDSQNRVVRTATQVCLAIFPKLLRHHETCLLAQIFLLHETDHWDTPSPSRTTRQDSGAIFFNWRMCFVILKHILSCVYSHLTVYINYVMEEYSKVYITANNDPIQTYTATGRWQQFPQLCIELSFIKAANITHFYNEVHKIQTMV